MALANGGALDDRCLLSLLLARHRRPKSAERLACRLITQYQSLSLVLSSPIDELVQVPGITSQIAIDLRQVKHLLAAISLETVSKRPVIDCYDSLISFCAGQFDQDKKEQFNALFLDKRYELLHHKCLQVGTLDHVTVYPRELLKVAIKHSASHIILTHNHPFGVASPSKADIEMTRQLSILSEGLGITILDHIIFAGNDNFSFLKNGMMKRQPPDLLNQRGTKIASSWI
ncbi:MAG: DNA repair protein RadC [Salaquimonas sp.]